jgi:ribosomal protein S18 acetylase RimI-like enzyme
MVWLDGERMTGIELTSVTRDRETFIPLLLEADESEHVVRSYLGEGELFQIRFQGRRVGVCLLVEDGEDVEIKNIAIEEGARGRGLGQQAIAAIAERATRLLRCVSGAGRRDGRVAHDMVMLAMDLASEEG